MAQLSEFLTPADLQKISNLQVLARLVVEQACIEFLQLRPDAGQAGE